MKTMFVPPRAGSLLAALALFFFLSVLVIPDSAEQYRAWKASLAWSPEERALAAPVDAGRQHAVALSALICATAVVSASAIAAFLLGLALAGEGSRLKAAATLLCGVCALCGAAYAVLVLAYRLGLGGLRLLKGPIHDYDLRLQPTILLGSLVLSLLSLTLPLLHLWRSRSRSADARPSS